MRSGICRGRWFGPFIGLLPDDWNWVSDLASIVIVALVIFELTTDYAKRAAILAAIHIECGELEILWQSLWHDVDAADAEEEAIRIACET